MFCRFQSCSFPCCLYPHFSWVHTWTKKMCFHPSEKDKIPWFHLWFWLGSFLSTSNKHVFSLWWTQFSQEVVFWLSPLSTLRENVFLFALPFRILASKAMRWCNNKQMFFYRLFILFSFSLGLCQSVACPCCKYANDSMFRYCQSCGYKRKILTVDQTQRTDDANLDVSALDNRLLQIASLSAGTSYSKKKSSLQKESKFFLAGCGPAGYHGTHWLAQSLYCNL